MARLGAQSLSLLLRAKSRVDSADEGFAASAGDEETEVSGHVAICLAGNVEEVEVGIDVHDFSFQHLERVLGARISRSSGQFCVQPSFGRVQGFMQ